MGEIGKAVSGIGFPDSEQQGKNGIPFYKVSDMNSIGNEVIMDNANNYVTQQQILNNGWKPISSTPAIIFAKVGAALILNRKRLVLKDFLIDNNTMAYIFDDSWHYYFGKTLFDTIYLPKLSQIGALPSFNASDLESLEIKRPKDIKEQTAIGNFFKQLDETIALHQRQTKKYQKLRQGFLQSIFQTKNPKISIKNTNTWEQRKLGEVFGKIRNAFVGTATPYYVEQGYFYLESNNVKNGQINRNTEVFINEAFYYAQRDKWLKENDLVMVQSGHVGHTAVIPKELDNTAAHALITFSDYRENADPHFLNYFFQTILAKLEIEKITTGNTIRHILSSDMKDFQINLPKYEEQTTIGNFFKQLDETIALHQRKIEKYQFIKQLYLEKMFIK